MPEGPEVQSLTDGLREHVQHPSVRLIDSRILGGRYLHKPPEGWEQLRERLPLSLHDVQNRGKFIYFKLSEGISLWSTLGMNGGWTLRQPHRHGRIELHLEHTLHADDDNVMNVRREVLTFFDSRNFGTFKVCFDEEELLARLAKLGASWLHDEVTLELFQELLSRGGKPQQRRLLAVFLMDQTKTSGIGNYILAEALYRARIHPWARVGQVAQNPELVKELHAAIRDISYGSFEAQVASSRRRAGLPPLPPLKSPEAFLKSSHRRGCGGSFEMQVYGRTMCPRGYPVVRDVNGPHKRTIHWVPAVQTLGV